MVSKKLIFFFYFSLLGKTDMVLGKNVAFFDWEWGPNSALREGQKVPCIYTGEIHAGKVKV